MLFQSLAPCCSTRSRKVSSSVLVQARFLKPLEPPLSELEVEEEVVLAGLAESDSS